MLTIKHYQQYVDDLPRASHDMEHITNFGKIVSRGFVLLASTIERSHQRTAQRLVEVLGGDAVDPEAARARRAAERKAKRRELLEQLDELEAEAEVDDADDNVTESDAA
jgi:hypothetical protein